MIDVDAKIERVVDLLRDILRPRKIVLFGSRAWGTAAVGSDIDIAVEGVRKPSVREERLLKDEIDIIAGLLSVDLLFLDDLEDEEMKSVIKEKGVILYEEK